jgi:1,4-alpha-glucan branching enzyme
MKALDVMKQSAEMKKPAAGRGRRGKKVVFQVAAAPGSEVYLAGTFNNWDPKQHQLCSDPACGFYKIALVLPPGRHEYKFAVNGEWHVDASCLERVPNDMGSLNSVILV